MRALIRAVQLKKMLLILPTKHTKDSELNKLYNAIFMIIIFKRVNDSRCPNYLIYVP